MGGGHARDERAVPRHDLRGTALHLDVVAVAGGDDVHAHGAEAGTAVPHHEVAAARPGLQSLVLYITEQSRGCGGVPRG